MKKQLFFPLIFIAFVSISGRLSGQCNPIIPAASGVISTSQILNGGLTAQWVCTGDTLTSNGGSFTVFLEPGAVMNTGGGIDSIFVKAGAVLNMNGGIHNIIFEPLSVLNIMGGIPHYDTCSGIHYDYIHAPAGGCLVTSVNNKDEYNPSVTVSPNPFALSTTISFPSVSHQQLTIIITDIAGKVIKRIYCSSKECVIEKGEMESGIYFLTVNSEQGMIKKKLIIM